MQLCACGEMHFSDESLIALMFVQAFIAITSCEARTMISTLSETTCESRANDNIIWKHSPIPGSNGNFSYQIVDENGQKLADCNSSGLLCNASNLSPGTVYTGYLVACFIDLNGKEVCIKKSKEANCTTSPNPPSSVTVEPFSSSSVKVVITPPEIAPAVERYTVSIEGGRSIPCDFKEDETRRSCVILGLSPSTQYIVNARSWLGGKFSSVSSVAARGSGWTKPPSPKYFGIKPLSSTALQVTIEPPENSYEIELYEVLLKDGEQATCSNDGRSSYRCVINNLKTYTQYNLTAQSCFNTSEGAICSDPVGNSSWTKPRRCSSEITVDKSSGESIEVSFDMNAEDSEGIKLTYFVHTFNADNAEKSTLKCETSGASVSCSIQGLHGCIGYNITAVACPPGSEKVTDLCSEPSDQLLAKTHPKPPTDLKVEHVSATSMELMWVAPLNNSAVEMYEVTVSSIDAVNMEDKKNCSSINCQIGGLRGNTLYSLSVRSWCPAYGTTPERYSDFSSPLQQLTKIDVPTSLKAILLGEEYILVEWVNPVQNTSDLKGCIQYIGVGTSSAAYNRIASPVEAGLQSLNVTRLTSNTEYEVEVCLHKSKQVNTSVCANPEIKVITLPKVPKLLSVASPKSNSLLVSWSSVDQRTADLFYEVKAYDILDTSKPKDFCYVSAKTSSASCKMTNLNPNTKYNVSIGAYRIGGPNNSNHEDVLYARTRPAYLRSVNASIVATYSITVTWQEVPNSQTALECINFTAKSGGDEKSCNLRPPRGNECTFENLEGGTEYSISGFACAPLEFPYPSSCSEESAAFTALTLPPPRGNCNVAEVTSDEIMVKCPKEAKRSTNNEVIESIVMARADRNSSSNDCTIPSKSDSCSVIGLKAGTYYSISLKSCFAGRFCGDEVFIVSISTVSSVNLALMISLVVVCVIVVVLAILLVVFGMRIKALRHQKVAGMDSSDPGGAAPESDFVINYFEPEKLYTGVDQLYPPIPFENFRDHIKSLESQDEIVAAFKNLDALANEQEELFRLSCNAAKQFRLHNRYCNILPYDQSLVILGRKWPMAVESPKPRVIRGPLRAAYVNASFVRRAQYKATGCAVVAAYSQPPDYIVAQGPLENTVADFLTMVYEQRVPHLIMLCRNKEGEKDKCARYWPCNSKIGAVETFTSDRRTVTVIFLNIEPLETRVRRVFTICPNDEKDPWTVTQIQTFVWDDFTCPDMDRFYELLQCHMDLNKKYPIGDFGPPVVHCSAGVGRSGTLICGRILLDQLHEDPSTIDVMGTVLAIRKWRKFLVQTEAQLKFLYDFVIYVIEREGLKPSTSLPPLMKNFNNEEEDLCSGTDEPTII